MGESAGLVFTAGPEEAQALARAVRAELSPGIEDVVPAADSVGLLVDPDVADLGDVLRLAAGLASDNDPGRSRIVEVEVCFDGPDIAVVAERARLSVPEVLAMVVGSRLSVGWLGFMPGFPYLVGLAEPLESVPRLDRPRTRVPAGAFAIAGGYAGIYPQATPGGWNVLGRTAVQLFDAKRPEPVTFAPGDLVRVRPVDSLSSTAQTVAGGQLDDGQPSDGQPNDGQPNDGQPNRWRPAIAAAGPRRLTVIEAGPLTSVQDRGRIGKAHLGVPRAGPADPLRHLIANIAVGNPETAAVLEVTVSGPTLRFGCDAYIALVGDCPLRIDGREMPPSTVQLVEYGQTVTVGTVRRTLHAYLGISGGVEVPTVLGSRSGDATSGLWPGALRGGDELDLGPAGRPRGRWFEPPASPGVLRVHRGPDGPASEAFSALVATDWTVDAHSDRVGTRLRPAATGPRDSGARAHGGPSLSAGLRPIASRATVTGAVQVPGDGCPIVLGPDHGTVGGYPVVAVISRSSLADSGELRPGDEVRFEHAGTEQTDRPEPLARRSVSGWMSTEIDGEH
jgi:KipI family sensor histidine kinase inhibitor